jgi:hypothetical protein
MLCKVEELRVNGKPLPLIANTIPRPSCLTVAHRQWNAVSSGRQSARFAAASASVVDCSQRVGKLDELPRRTAMPSIAVQRYSVPPAPYLDLGAIDNVQSEP